ncbi:MAG: ABC transporter permease [Acidobacteriota bacterium]
MLASYSRIAVRNLVRQFGYTLINILGLAVGIAASVLILLYVIDELSFDRFHEKADRIYRVVADWSNKGDSAIHQLGTPLILARTLRDKYPQAESVTQVIPLAERIVRYKNQSFRLTDAYYAETSFFDVFTFPLERGDPRTALRDPQSIVLTRSVAARYFGAEDPMDKLIEVISLMETKTFRVTGILEDVPRNSHFCFGALLSLPSFRRYDATGWTSNNLTTYLLLRQGVTEEQMEQKLVELDRKYFEGGRPHIPWIWSLEPLKRIHLYSDLVTGNQPNGSIEYVKLFTIAALLILLIAGVNFINLSTARSARRAKEVGIRKVCGSMRWHLAAQFLGESVLLSLIAMIVAVGMILLSLPFYRELTEKYLSLKLFSNPLVIPALLALALLVGILAGLYPAFALASSRQVDALRGSLFRGKGRRSSFLRNGLVVFQFSVSVVLIIGSLVIFKQLRYVRNFRLGFEKDHIAVIRNANSLGSAYEPFKQKLLSNARVISTTGVFDMPGDELSNWGIAVEGVGPERPLNLDFVVCDEDFVKTLGIKMLDGRFFSRDFPSDTRAAVVSKRAVEYFAIRNPVGKVMRIYSDQPFTIIGVMDDIHFASLHNEVRGMGYVLPSFYELTAAPYLLVRIQPTDLIATLDFMKTTWSSLAPGMPFDVSFLDEKIDSLYKADRLAGRIVLLFSILAVFVSCLGLFGLAAFVTEQRTKEIGIRKALGAGASHITFLLTAQFSKWVVVANVVSWPLGYLLMSRWLEGFAFRTRITADVFMMGGLVALLTATTVVSSQVLKAAAAKPVDALKWE